MTLEDRMEAMEKRIDCMEEKRRALRSQFIALQFVLIRLLPVISAPSTDRFDGAIADAEAYALNHLLAAGYAPEDIHEVLASIAALRADMAETGIAEPSPPCR